ncbi:hypothetical protein JKF63_04105 [Porcisia hertigi]|uniref:Glutathione peroxidase n=1 Tax=Porcisia hertigi TaxID=2761500 RepID=A0A836IRY5_9TRYP|nr:hypothetical protein JKF63_04105 [Porcisia hertigi]
MSAGDYATSALGMHSASTLNRTLCSDTSAGRKESLEQTWSRFETLAQTEGVVVEESDHNSRKTIYDFQVLNCYQELYDLSQHRGSVVLICNVASECKDYTESGYTTLVRLFRKHRREGFVVLAFPSDEFGNGEPGNEEEIAENISCLYPNIGEVEFPIMAKSEMNGNHELPLFGFLKRRIRGTLGQSAVRWNFTCFLVDQKGAPYARFEPGASMAEIDARIEELLHPTPPRVPMPHLHAADLSSQAVTSSAENGLGVCSVVHTSSLNEHNGCGTPSTSGWTHSEFPVVVSTTNMTRQDSPMASEDVKLNPDSFANQTSLSMLNATRATVEGYDSMGSSTLLHDATAAGAQQPQ